MIAEIVNVGIIVPFFVLFELKKIKVGPKKKQGRLHGSISLVRVGRGSIVVGQGQ